MMNQWSGRIKRLAAVGLASGLLAALWLLTAWAAPLEEAGSVLGKDPLADSGQLSGGTFPFWIENAGQFDPRARFLLRHGLGQTWLGSEPTIWVSAWDQEAVAQAKATAEGERAFDHLIPAVNLRFRFLGANPRPVIETSAPRSTRVSFFRGSEPEGWFRDVPVWGQVRYRDLYPGVDLVFSENPGGLAQPGLPWHLEATPGADLEAVRLLVEGAATVDVLGGEMSIEAHTGPLSFPLPSLASLEEGLAYLAADEVSPEVRQLSQQAFLISGAVAAGKGVLAEAAVGPEYSTYLGGSSWDWAYGVGIDEQGAAYVAGVTPSPDFPTVSGSYSTTLQAQDAFVVKVVPDGSDLEYATFVGGSGYESGYGVAVANGEAFVTGETWSPDFPTTQGAHDRSCGAKGDCDGWTDAFLIGLNASGSDLLYATFLGGKDEDFGNAVEVSSGEVYVVGNTWSDDFRTTVGAYDRTCGTDGRCDPESSVPTADAFLAKLSPDGNGVVDLLYATYLGGSDADGANDVAVSGGDAYVTGDSSSPDFPAAGYVGSDDAFVVRINPGGKGAADLMYAKFLGGTGTDRGYGIAVTGSSAAVTGETRSSGFPVTTGVYNGGFNDAFVATLDGGGSVTYAAFLGGSDRDLGSAIALEGSGAMIVAGYTQSLSDTFPVTEGAYDRIQNGGRDAFVARIFLESSRPQHITYASYLGGIQDEEAHGVAVDESGSAYLVGYTRSVTDFPITAGAFSPTYNGGTRDAFVSKLKVGGAAGLSVEKSVNGLDADAPPGPYLTVGDAVTWTYVVANTGGSDLSNVTVEDDLLGPICEEAFLPSGGSFTCSRQGTAEAGQYVNAATVIGQSEGEVDPVSDVDLSHYFGAAPQIELVKLTNGQDAGAPPGPMILVGDTVTWTYVVTNTGNVRLSELSVTDTLEGPVACDVASLAGNQSMTCILTGTASMGPYSNIASVVGTPPGGLAPVSHQDTGYYFGAEPVLVMTKRINGQIARQAPGPYLLAGEAVTWTYDITNTGNVPLTLTTVTDDHGLSVTCERQDLAVDQAVRCQAVGAAGEGVHVESALVLASAPVGPDISASDIGHYFGVRLEATFQKRTNGQDGSGPPGLFLLPGDPVTWTYHLTSTSNVALDVEVQDSREGAIGCEDSTLDPGGVITCTADGVATPGLYTNTGTVTLAPPGDLPPLVLSDASRYFGMEPGVVLDKRTNGEQGELPRQLYLAVGSPVQWTYQVTNSGNVTLTQILVTDDQEGTVACPKGSLAPGEPMMCTASGTAELGDYGNLATVTGTLPTGQTVGASDTSHYFGIYADLAVRKMTYNPENGGMVDADQPPGPEILEGSVVTWTYVITNTGDADLVEVGVVDEPQGSVECPQTSLAPQSFMTCHLVGVAVAGQYTNTATVAGRILTGTAVVSDTAVNHYFGTAPALELVKLTNGVEAQEPPGPTLGVGDPVAWTYVVRNTGNVPLTGVSVTDDRVALSSDCGWAVLAVSETVSCQASGVALEGQYTNVATATASYGEVTVADVARGHYLGGRYQVYLPLVQRR